MKKLIIALSIMILVPVLWLGCGGGSSSSSTTGSVLITGATSTTSAFKPSFKISSAPTFTGIPFTSLKMKAYRVYLSLSADCSNPVLVQNKTAGASYQELMSKPTLFSGNIAPGTYNCLIIESSDIIYFTPGTGAAAATSNVCLESHEYTFDIYKTEMTPENWYDIVSNTTTTGQGTYSTPGDQSVSLFASTDLNQLPAIVHTHQQVPLLTPVVIAAGQTTNAAFVIDPSNRLSVVNDGSDHCWMEGATISFLSQ